MDITLVLGGARSGKSTYAESLALARNHTVYIATAEIVDAEMANRVRHHRERRNKAWATLEEPLELAAAIRSVTAPDCAVLVDCLTLWLSNLMHAGRDIDAESEALLSCLQTVTNPVILVANEIGLGIVPDNRLAREFRDHAGRLHQGLAAIAQRVYFVVAGIPITVKDIS